MVLVIVCLYVESTCSPLMYNKYLAEIIARPVSPYGSKQIHISYDCYFAFACQLWLNIDVMSLDRKLDYNQEHYVLMWGRLRASYRHDSHLWRITKTTKALCITLITRLMHFYHPKYAIFNFTTLQFQT